MGSDPSSSTLARQLPINQYVNWDGVGPVMAAIKELEYGFLTQASLLVDSMMRDDRIRGTLQQRVDSIPSLPFELEAADAPQGQAAVEQLDKDFASMFPPDVLEQMWEWGTMLNVALVQIIWRYDKVSGLWTFTTKVWHPKYLRFNEEDQNWYLQTRNQGEIVVTPGDGQWILYTPRGKDRAYARGLVRCLTVPWLIRQWTLRDWARWSEVYGTPIRKAYVPAGADEEQKQRFIRELAAIGRDTALRLPGRSSDKDQSFDVELLEATSTGFDGFDKLLSKVENAIAIAVLGQNLTTEVKGGAYAAAEVHKQIRGDILRGDAYSMGACLWEQAIQLWASFNFGDPMAAPKPCWKTDPPEDVKAMGEAMKALGDGITTLAATGAKPDTDAILEKAGVPTTGPSEEPEAMAPDEGAGAEDDGGEADAQDPNVDPGAAVAAHTMLARAGKKAAKSAPPGAAAVRGQAYVDEVAGKAAGLASHVIAEDLQHILAIVSSASSFEEVRAKLLAQASSMSPERLEQQLVHALVLSDLAGRFSIAEDVGTAKDS